MAAGLSDHVWSLEEIILLAIESYPENPESEINKHATIYWFRTGQNETS